MKAYSEVVNENQLSTRLCLVWICALAVVGLAAIVGRALGLHAGMLVALIPVFALVNGVGICGWVLPLEQGCRAEYAAYVQTLPVRDLISAVFNPATPESTRVFLREYLTRNWHQWAPHPVLPQ